MRRAHPMPFGCTVLPGGACFRLWAPAAHTVQLHLDAGGRRASLPMPDAGDGWRSLEVPRVQPDARYRFELDGGLLVPDPASRFNPDDVHGPSVVVDPLAFEWQDDGWRGRPLEELVVYELHVGSFTPEGTFEGVEQRLGQLQALGVTALELMPIADFPGRRNWGYDGVLAFAPDARYGAPDDLKRLVQSAHRRGLMVFVDVVYNHFGPEGNYLHLYAPQFFTAAHRTPWGDAINFDGARSATVREFFVHNALYWLEEYHLDGLRLDAVHAIRDESQPDILEQISQAVRAGPGTVRHVHLIIEDDENRAHRLGRRPGASGRYDAQWNDDVHHAVHVIATGEQDGYYADYAQTPLAQLGRCLAQGFAYQGEPSAFRGGRPRGEPSTHLRPTAFVTFLQNHDQIGNRAFGERLVTLVPPERLRALVAILLLAPQPPLLFMGEEWGAREPFPFFCDFEPGLARRVTEGRREEFARFGRFADPAARSRIPDPAADATFDAARLDWSVLARPEHAHWLQLYSSLLALRAREIVPRLAGMDGGAQHGLVAPGVLSVRWVLGDRSELQLTANLRDEPSGPVQSATGRVIYRTHAAGDPGPERPSLPPWAVLWTLTPRDG